MKIKYLTIAVLFFFISFGILSAQVKVTTKDNNVFYGIILENKNDSLNALKLESEEHLKISIPVSNKNILSVKEINCFIKQKNSSYYEGKVLSISDKKISMFCEDGAIYDFNYDESKILFYNPVSSFIGFTIGTPGGINATFGSFLTENFGLSASIGHIPNKMLGAQLSCLFNISRGIHFEHNLGIGIGGFTEYSEYRNDDNDDWIYSSVFYELNLYGFYIQPGISYGHGSYSNPQFLFQLGYVYRFND